MANWQPIIQEKGYVTTYASVRGKQGRELEERLGLNRGRLDQGFAIYALTEIIKRDDFGWRDTTAFSDGREADPDTKLSQDDDVYLVPRQDMVRFHDAKRRGYRKDTTPAELETITQQNDQAMERLVNQAFNSLRKLTGDDRIVKVKPAKLGGTYPNSGYYNVPQWELLKPKQFRLLDVVLSDKAQKLLSGADWWHANEAKWATSTSLDDLVPTFAFKVKRFIKALEAAGARVEVSATRRPKQRAHLMHYCVKVGCGEAHPANVPEVDGLDILWDHAQDEKSRAAAREMARLFKIAFPASLNSLHIRGKAIDLTITWNQPITVKDGHGRAVTIAGPGNGAYSAALHKLGKSYGVIKLVKDAPHWSVNGR